MPPFQSNPINPSRMNTLLRKHPSLFGVPFVLMMLGASFGLASFTQTRYELHDQKVSQVRTVALPTRNIHLITPHSRRCPKSKSCA